MFLGLFSVKKMVGLPFLLSTLKRKDNTQMPVQRLNIHAVQIYCSPNPGQSNSTCANMDFLMSEVFWLADQNMSSDWWLGV